MANISGLTKNPNENALKTSMTAVEGEVKILKKHMGGIVQMLKELKSTVEVLGKKNTKEENVEIQEILDAQKVIDEVIVANADAIKRINKEIKELSEKESHRNLSNDALENVVSDSDQVKRNKVKKRCRYYNRGYCKYKHKCRYSHPKHICKEFLENGACTNTDCMERHPIRCKWVKSEHGCSRSNCEYLHNTLPINDSFKCAGCLDIWNDPTCVIQHVIRNQEIYFCLNCNDWIKEKSRVFDQGWTLLNEQGFLRTGI